MYSFGTRSKRRLKGVHPDIVRVMERAISMGVMDFTILEGVRTPARQRKLYAQGRTEPGNIVTWTLNSRHFKQHDGYGHAVDIAPWPINWQNEDKFWMLRGLIMAAAAVEKVDLEFLKSGRDLPHFQLVT